MSATRSRRVALLYPGDRAARDRAGRESNRFANVAAALAQVGIDAEPAVYANDFVGEVRQQLLGCEAVLVWVNPIESGRDRTVLDAMLREVAASGTFVSAHPDVILKLGTKDVLFEAQGLGWGSDVRRYMSPEALRLGLISGLRGGVPRVLKQYRGNGGQGVWKVELADPEATGSITDDTPLRVRHAARGAIEEVMTLGDFLRTCRVYFAGEGRMIDQAFQHRLVDGMLRCYLVHDRVAGFGHQAVNALYPAAKGADPRSAPQPGTRLYHPPDHEAFQAAKTILESDWVPSLQGLFGLRRNQLPVLWDIDLLLGPRDETGNDSYVLCEINVSSVSPFPESALPMIAEAVAVQLAPT